mmetsp:Transcript_18989/g.24673  ORF Transcript_18989/g.24673 Transcript_18989/m.24673 type:complete len:135 (-) Transcript_18989:222-626(-)|eukprot:CAMPEP_0116058818 /NCGR_PEP_ID=MMETSP0322-20121206/5431_1 /TAXON_ID=163516 /ORGANISM="Leptocylindrus danicus var. apora, Strain B651" /LENGTH=134 /DNA_ID=CAMNT_0003543089 /DNA_START=238 /DNA_END=642 /DNA_ORIENTATION=-
MNAKQLCLILTLHSIDAWMTANSPLNGSRSGGSGSSTTRLAKEEDHQDVHVQNQIDYFETQFVSDFSQIGEWIYLLDEPCEGRECDVECEIPRDMKSQIGNFDALDYLGLKRVESLSAKKNTNSCSLVSGKAWQ